jgi:hypothetical protein
MTDNSEYIKREREYDEEKKRKFLKELDKESKPKGIKEKIATFREGRKYRAFQRAKQKEIAKEERRKRIEKKVFGHEPTAEERREYEKYKEDRDERRKQRLQRIGSGFKKAGTYANEVAERADDYYEESKLETDPLLSMYGVGQKKSRRDPLMEMFGVNPPRADMPKKPKADPLVEMFGILPQKIERRKGFKKGLDVGDYSGNGGVDVRDQFGSMFPKRKKGGKGGMFDDMLYRP